MYPVTTPKYKQYHQNLKRDNTDIELEQGETFCEIDAKVCQITIFLWVTIHRLNLLPKKSVKRELFKCVRCPRGYTNPENVFR